MTHHAFIFEPGIWEGEGMITFSMADDVLDFSTHWTLLPKVHDEISFQQEVKVKEFAEKTCNHFTLSNIRSETFSIVLENHLVGKVEGLGVFTPKTIAWEFRNSEQGFEGFEIYELQDDGTYKMRAEFTAGDGLRTFIKGFIAQKHS